MDSSLRKRKRATQPATRKPRDYAKPPRARHIIKSEFLCVAKPHFIPVSDWQVGYLIFFARIPPAHTAEGANFIWMLDVQC
jgi:hypothetical protein